MLEKFHIRGNLTLKIANLAPTWSQLGSILGGFWAPSWNQVGTKWHQNATQQIIKKMIALGRPQDRFLSIFGSNLGGPGWERELGFGVFFRSWGLLGAKMAPRATQEAPGAAQEAPRHPPRPIFGAILDPCSGVLAEDPQMHAPWAQLEPSWSQLGPNMGPT